MSSNHIQGAAISTFVCMLELAADIRQWAIGSEPQKR